MKSVLVTGGCGFIGSEVVRRFIKDYGVSVFNVDKLTYAGHKENLTEISNSSMYQFAQVDICDRQSIREILKNFQPDGILHLAAESHVDRSIDAPADFIETNIVGTFSLLEEARIYLSQCSPEKKKSFRFLTVSTDEVFGSLGSAGFFTENSIYQPSSPYSASKASSDHLTRAWGHTFGLPVIITNCSNNYGPYQFPEKLIPLAVQKLRDGKPVPVYGDGKNIRDWLHVSDHAKGLYLALSKGKVGETYVIGGHGERSNLDVVEALCDIVEGIKGLEKKSLRSLIDFVKDRPGHDFRYAIDPRKIENELGWRPDFSFERGLKQTVEWYLSQDDWIAAITNESYQGQRLGSSSSR